MDFTGALREAARSLDNWVLSLLFVFALTVEISGNLLALSLVEEYPKGLMK
ncbi:MAG: hypothetical protein ACI9YL_000618 [Luteibaculaceae bacterium]|jgi:hypothetical protein